MNPTCPHCVKAELQPWRDGLDSCSGCRARRISRTRAFARAQQSEALDLGYVALLQAAEVTHEQVLAAAEADFEASA